MKSASEVRDAVKGELTHYLAEQRDYLTSIASELVPVCDALEDYLLEGGKRLRPLFAYAGFMAAGATPSTHRYSCNGEPWNSCKHAHLFMMT